MRETGTGFGAGKVILLGEHAVVHGSPAIAAGLRRGVAAVARRSDEDVLHVTPWNRIVRPDPEGDDPLCRALAAALDDYPKRPSLRLEVRVDLPPGAGKLAAIQHGCHEQEQNGTDGRDSHDGLL